MVELTATRLLAPFYGQAFFVWTNVIGLVLLGLALGSMAGGRWADRWPKPTILAALIAAAAALVVASAYTPAPLSRALLPERLPLESSYPFLLRGSFVTTLVCFVPPVFLLGAVPPFLVRCCTQDLQQLGARSGLLYGASTLGSILGTFLTTYVLLPGFGSRGSLLLAAMLLMLSAAPLVMGSSRTGALMMMGGILVTGALGMHPSSRRPLSGMSHGDLVAAQESHYQHIEIRERPDLNSRVLTLDEGNDSYHSILPESGYLTGGYYDSFLIIAHLAKQAAGTLDVLILGFAGGTHARQLLHGFGETTELRVVGVELDPEVVQLSREHLELPDDPRLEVISDMDARVYLLGSDRQFDLVIVDCYAQQSYLPFHLISEEFFKLARRNVRPGGYLALNLSGYGSLDPIVQAVTNTMAQEFRHGTVLCRIPDTINFLVYARRDEIPVLPQELDPDAVREDLRPVLEPLQAPIRCWREEFSPERMVLTDHGGDAERLQAQRLKNRARALLGNGP